MTPRLHAKVIKAWADGVEVGILGSDGIWETIGLPAFSKLCQYRVKPAPKPRYRVAEMLGAPDGLGKMGVYVAVTTGGGDLESLSNFSRWLTDWIEFEPGDVNDPD